MDRAEIYLRAAERVAVGCEKYTCVSIGDVRQNNCMKRYGGDAEAYTEMFDPGQDYRGDAYHYFQETQEERLQFAYLDIEPFDARQNCRVLALCFAAAMAKTGDL